MSIWSVLGGTAGRAAAETIKGAAEGIATLAQGLRGAITGELPPETRARLEELAMQAEAQARVAQLAVNQVEAAHRSLFVAGWRPFVGWTCGAALAYHFVAQPGLAFLVTLYAWQVPPLPTLDVEPLLTLLLGMLGLAGLRTYEKTRGVEGNR